MSNITAASVTAATTANATSSKRNDAALAKEDFLSLLVAQLQNQDPLNPSDPTEFTAQLAQFSSLEQLFNLNDSMENLATSNANADRFATLNTIGKEVSYPANSFDFTGGPVNVGYLLDGQAKDVTLSLQLDGVTVASLRGEELNSGAHFLTWDGLTADGKAAPVGKYKIVVSAKAADGQSVSAQSLVRSEVTGVDLGGDYGGTLITAAGQISFGSIVGVYEKAAASSSSSGLDQAIAVADEAAEALREAGE
ncbi:MAG: flagellar hook assembly protein FlgD [Desulfobulbaceae bacterium]|jgi:flagellar basal-body rod modification protein FlgD|nr:flagellar hook assembly protein FlgD [Desulfobulbaceae bacterium]